MEKGNSGIDRRSFVMGTAAAGAGALAAAGGLAGTIETARAEEIEGEASEETSGEELEESVEEETESSWRTAPEAITDDEIVAEYSADVIVIGMGHAGTSCARYIAENGGSVIGLESQEEDVYSVFGEDFGHINSQWILDQGVDYVDPIEFFNNWMLNSQNLANPSLVMKFAQNCGDTFDWWVEALDDEFMEKVTLDFWPRGENTISEISGQKFWNGTPQFIEDGATMTDAFSVFHGLIIENGGEIHYGVTAEQLESDGERITGVIASNTNGEYVRYKASKGVVLAAGGFGGNEEMRKELCTSIADMVDEDYEWTSMDRDGSGIKMGVWAGGHVEPRTVPTMGGDTSQPSIAEGSMTGVWFNENGDRFCNEFFGDPIWTGRTVMQQNYDTIYCLYDDKLMSQLEYNIPAHGRFDPTDEDEVTALQEVLDSALAASPEGVEGASGTVYAANTLEELCDAAGMSEDVKEEFLSQVERYNEFCAEGVDEDFGKDSRVLWAIDTPPYYLNVSPVTMIAFFLVTVGGLVTDGDQRVLDDDNRPIEGLYATGNCCGRRFGSAYFSPTAGVSVGIANTLGRELGKYLMGE